MDEILEEIIRDCKDRVIKRKAGGEEFKVDKIIINIQSEIVDVVIFNPNRKLVCSLEKIRSDFTSEEP